MNRSIILMPLLGACALVLGACNPPINANEKGGIVTYGGIRVPKAFNNTEATELMEQHCQRYGKTAEPKGLPPGDADTIVRWQFQCVNP